MNIKTVYFRLRSFWWTVELKTSRICGIIGHKLRCWFGLRRIESVTITYNNEYGSESISAIECDHKRIKVSITGAIVSIRGAGRYFGDAYNSDADRRETIIDLRNPSIIDITIYEEGDQYER